MPPFLLYTGGGAGGGVGMPRAQYYDQQLCYFYEPETAMTDGPLR